MHVESALYYHVEAVAMIAHRDRSAPVGPAELASALAIPPAFVGDLLSNLTAAGLLSRVEGPAECGYRLARGADTITLEEIATLAVPRAARDRQLGGGDPWTAAQGMHALSSAVQNRTLTLLADLTVADLLAREGLQSRETMEPRGMDSWLMTPDDAAADLVTAEPDRLLTRILTADELWAWGTERRPHMVIDVRDVPCEDGEQGPPWSHWIRIHRLPSCLRDLPLDRPIVTVCTLGMRSFLAAHYLACAGFPRVYTLLGGLAAWNRARRADRL